MKTLPYIVKQKYTETQRRVLLIGPPKFGKTWSALTAPNPVVIDFDRGLATYPQEVMSLPFWDKQWVLTNFKTVYSSEALIKFLKTDALTFENDQTLIFDSLSTISDALANELEAKCPVNVKGEKDNFWYWKQWSNWLCQFCTLLTGLNSHCILICHEQEVRDNDSGKIIGYRFLLKGQDFPPRLPQYFTDIIRAVRKTEINKDKATVKFMWQIKPDSMNPGLYCRANCDDVYVNANWEEICR